MGCCLSTNTTSLSAKTPHLISNSTEHNGGSKSPLLHEVETVKEVLSEINFIPRKRETQKKHHQNDDVVTLSGNDELSEVDSAEICITQSESTTVSVSTALTEKSQNIAEFQRRIRNRSFPGEVKREKKVGRSQGRSIDQTPNRNGHGTGYGKRRNKGDSSSGRRSWSPVIRSDSDGSKEGGESTSPSTSNELLENSLMSLECYIFL